MHKNKCILIFVLICFMFILNSCGNSNSPERIVNKYFSAVKAGDLDNAIECLTPSAQEHYEASLALSKALLGSINIDVDLGAIYGGIIGPVNSDTYKDYEFKVTNSSKLDDSHSIVSVDIYVNNKKVDTTTVQCIKYDNKWYIEN